VSDALATVADVEVRLRRSFNEAESAQVAAYILDVSGQIYTFLGSEDAFHPLGEGLSLVPQSVRAIVCAAVIRAMDNPRGLTGETLGDYSWQANGGGSALGLWLTGYERRLLRRAYGASPVGTLSLEGYLPLNPHSLDDIGYGDDLVWSDGESS
jgi:hypothetical protein